MSNYILPDEYKTGNKMMDEKIAIALEKQGGLKSHIDEANKIKFILGTKTESNRLLSGISPLTQQVGRSKIPVSTKDMRTYKDGTLFASRGEMLRYDYLFQLQREGSIKHLKTQVPFVLQESFISKQKEWGDVQQLIYVADFVYTNVSYRKGYEGRECVEDHKGGYVTDVYKIKRKLFLCKFAYYLFFEVGDEERR